MMFVAVNLHLVNDAISFLLFLYLQVSAGVIPITPKWTDKPITSGKKTVKLAAHKLLLPEPQC